MSEKSSLTSIQSAGRWEVARVERSAVDSTLNDGRSHRLSNAVLNFGHSWVTRVSRDFRRVGDPETQKHLGDRFESLLMWIVFTIFLHMLSWMLIDTTFAPESVGPNSEEEIFDAVVFAQSLHKGAISVDKEVNR